MNPQPNIEVRPQVRPRSVPGPIRGEVRPPSLSLRDGDGPRQPRPECPGPSHLVPASPEANRK